MTTPVTNTSPAGATGAAPAPGKAAFATLDSGDFLRLLTEQLKHQDPFEPVDNKEMLAQMAQFSALAGSTEGNATLQAISDKLDQLILAQQAGTGLPTSS